MDGHYIINMSEMHDDFFFHVSHSYELCKSTRGYNWVTAVYELCWADNLRQHFHMKIHCFFKTTKNIFQIAEYAIRDSQEKGEGGN